MMCKWFVYGFVGFLCLLGVLGIVKFGVYL